MFAHWEVLHNEPATGRRLEGKRLLEEYDFQKYPIFTEKSKWLAEAEQVVRFSIEGGYEAKLVIKRVSVYRRLRMQHHALEAGTASFGEIRGVVVPRVKTIFFSNHGRHDPKVLYEEMAHGLAHPVLGSARRENARFERYKCHLQIYEGLARSEFFPRMWFFQRKEIYRLLAHLQVRCRLRLLDLPHPCTCTL